MESSDEEVLNPNLSLGRLMSKKRKKLEKQENNEHLKKQRLIRDYIRENIVGSGQTISQILPRSGRLFGKNKTRSSEYITYGPGYSNIPKCIISKGVPFIGRIHRYFITDKHNIDPGKITTICPITMSFNIYSFTNINNYTQIKALYDCVKILEIKVEWVPNSQMNSGGVPVPNSSNAGTTRFNVYDGFTVLINDPLPQRTEMINPVTTYNKFRRFQGCNFADYSCSSWTPNYITSPLEYIQWSDLEGFANVNNNHYLSDILYGHGYFFAGAMYSLSSTQSSIGSEVTMSSLGFFNIEFYCMLYQRN